MSSAVSCRLRVALLADAALRTRTLGSFGVGSNQTEAREHGAGLGLSLWLPKSIPDDREFSAGPDGGCRGGSRLSLRHRLPIVLLMGGGMGPTRMDEVARALADAKVGAHLIAVAGKDDRARRRLESLRVNDRVSLRVLGWTDDVPELMQAAAILVTKPGG